MFSRQSNGLTTSILLSGVSGLVHAYTNRDHGDMKKNKTNRKKVLAGLWGHNIALITAEQVHSGDAVVVNSFQKSCLSGVDALVYQKKLSDKPVMLGVFVADCLPILMADPKNRVVAVVHAGWKGTLSGITTKTVHLMKSMGSLSQDILVSIGPHIGMCCYDVEEDRAQMFRKTFGDDPKVASIAEGAWHVDLGWVNRKQLIDSGVFLEHIDASSTCTSCQNNEFFSYRKESPETFGEILGLIGYR